MIRTHWKADLNFYDLIKSQFPTNFARVLIQVGESDETFPTLIAHEVAAAVHRWSRSTTRQRSLTILGKESGGQWLAAPELEVFGLFVCPDPLEVS